MMLLAFALDEMRCALDISTVERAYRAVAVTPLPKALDIVHGIIDVHGRIFPVINVRKRFHLPEKELAPSDQIIVAHTPARPVALVVDGIAGVIECTGAEITPADAILPGMEHVKGVARLKDGMILIQDLGRFLSLEEEAALAGALGEI